MRNPAKLGQDCVPRKEEEGEGGMEEGDPNSGKVISYLLLTLKLKFIANGCICTK